MSFQVLKEETMSSSYYIGIYMDWKQHQNYGTNACFSAWPAKFLTCSRVAGHPCLFIRKTFINGIHYMAPALPAKQWKLAVRSTHTSLHSIKTKTSQGKIKKLKSCGVNAQAILESCQSSLGMQGKCQLSFECEERTWDAGRSFDWW